MDCGRKPECREKGALGEHANYSQKDLSPDFEPRPSCCVAKEQTSTPLCWPLLEVCRSFQDSTKSLLNSNLSHNQEQNKVTESSCIVEHDLQLQVLICKGADLI